MPDSNNPFILQGIIVSICASVFFALMPAYLQWLPSLSGYAMTGQRIIWTTIILAVFLVFSSQVSETLQPLSQVKNWPGLIAGAFLVGLQWLLFVWGPLNGETLGMSLGYFLLPMVLVIIGRFFLKEALSPAQWLATGIALLAIISNLWRTGHFPLIALAVAVGYPMYFMLRRKQPLPILSAFFLENVLLLPIAWWACIHFEPVNNPFAYSSQSLILFLGLGALGSAGMLCMLSASRKLPIALFGLLGYLEPPLIMGVGMFVIGEQIKPGEAPTYILICIALLVLTIDGARKVKRMRKRYRLSK
jgi:chloramphenicol-sensitive protein RarD